MKTTLDRIVEHACQVVLGKQHEVKLALTCLLARGHLLIEDLPGVGKTTLAHVLAQTLGLQYQRIQFTSDLLPSDILGVSIFDKSEQGFHFHPGPIFAQLILADEVNRATPKAQSALLEAMEECQVTTEGLTRPLPRPFFVIATQNPTYQIGTFPLPESQLDRFLMRISLGYPDTTAERELLTGQDRHQMLQTLTACAGADQLADFQSAVPGIHVSSALLDYLQALLTTSRQSASFITGLSPRAGLGLLHSAQAWAMLEGRNHVLPEDVQMMLPHVVGHRLRSTDTDDLTGQQSVDTCLAELRQVRIP